MADMINAIGRYSRVYIPHSSTDASEISVLDLSN